MEAIKMNKVGERKCIVLTQEGKWIQVVIIPSAWENKYYVVTEDLEDNTHLCALWTEGKIIRNFGDVASGIFPIKA